MVLSPPNPFAIILFCSIIVVVAVIILRRPFNRSPDTSSDLESISLPDQEELSETAEDSDQSDTERSDGHRAPPGRKGELPFSEPRQSTQFGGGFKHLPSDDEQFGGGFRPSETPGLDSTPSWALPPEEGDDREDDDHRRVEDETNEHGEYGSRNNRDNDHPSPYLFGEQDNRSDDQSND